MGFFDRFAGQGARSEKAIEFQIARDANHYAQLLRDERYCTDASGAVNEAELRVRSEEAALLLHYAITKKVAFTREDLDRIFIAAKGAGFEYAFVQASTSVDNLVKGKRLADALGEGARE